MSADPLFQPLPLGAITLAHRVVMAPLTRLRSRQPGNVPTALNAEYYGQRASRGGLVIAEATNVSDQARGYPGAPGLHTPEQVAGWRGVAEAVHRKGGFLFVQLWHTGRVSHSSMHGGALPVAPSAIPAVGKHMDVTGAPAEFEVPRALALAELPGIVAQFRHAAECAKAAGADGVEVHGANGYLLDQFLQNSANQRDDAYGGSIANRARLLLEVVDAVSEVLGADRVGVRLSPYGVVYGTTDTDPEALFNHVAAELDRRGVAYLHVIEPRVDQHSDTNAFKEDRPSDVAGRFKAIFRGPVIAAGGFVKETAERALREGHADAIAFGRLFIANPDLPERLRSGAAMNRYDRATFYGGDARGYTDYAALAEQRAA
ncbi:alkene reductase [Roseomonas sp. BN140053]|uniref:alkene reductase n=1 Tax=Roseomonas sp. BN140053 TaxID=3391898 RepID=UPI0039EB247C